MNKERAFSMRISFMSVTYDNYIRNIAMCGTQDGQRIFFHAARCHRYYYTTTDLRWDVSWE